MVFILSAIAALAVPTLRAVNLRARSAATVNDLRVFTAAFQAYAHERNDWPPGESAPGQVPAGMAGYLGQSNWERVTPIGGRYTWAPNTLQQGERYRAALVIATTAATTVSAERQQLEEIDRALDDGGLETGNFRLGFRNHPVFVLEH